MEIRRRVTASRHRRASDLVLAGLLLGVESLIAACGGTLPFLRGTIGDTLAVALVYFALRGFWNVPRPWAVGLSVGCGFGLELLQWLDVPKWLGIAEDSLWTLVLGRHASWGDLLAYGAGGALVVGFERLRWGPGFTQSSNP